jgi:hypothetical protein
MGLVAYVAASLTDMEVPFIASLVAALLTWGIGCAVDSAKRTS